MAETLHKRTIKHHGVCDGGQHDNSEQHLSSTNVPAPAPPKTGPNFPASWMRPMVLALVLVMWVSSVHVLHEEGGFSSEGDWTPTFEAASIDGKALESLQVAGLTDSEGRWAGGDAQFVQTGDQTDRGADGIDLIMLLERLKLEAAEVGGKVDVLVGNHELMNLQGNFAYVDEREYEELGKGDIAAGQRTYQGSFAPGGVVRRVIEKRDLALVAGEGPCRSLFVHAGVAPSLVREGGGGIDGMNERFRELMAATAVPGGERALPPSVSALSGNRGPVWQRAFAMAPESRVCGQIEETLELVGAARMVIGHTVQSRGMTTRCGGLLHLIDVGMSRAYTGRVAAWECSAEGVVAIYAGGRREVLQSFS